MTNDLSPLIADLLLEHDCVVVPGLGAFLTRRVAASYDATRQLMLPPHKEVAFNAELVHEDALLADALRRRGGLDYALAQKAVAQWVAQIRSRLAHGQRVTMGDLGLLEGGWQHRQFRPAAANDLDPEAYGLAPVRAQEHRQGLLANLDLRALRNAAAAAAAVLLLLLVSTRTGDPTLPAPTEGTYQGSIIGTLTGEPQPPAATATANAPEAATERPEHTTTLETELQEQPVAGNYVVVASFLTRQEAADYIASMRAGGHGELAVLDYGGRCRVTAARFAANADAQKAARDIRAIRGFEQAWVLAIE